MRKKHSSIVNKLLFPNINSPLDISNDREEDEEEEEEEDESSTENYNNVKNIISKKMTFKNSKSLKLPLLSMSQNATERKITNGENGRNGGNGGNKQRQRTVNVGNEGKIDRK